MSTPILREDVFPFVCQNPTCPKQYNIEGFVEVLNLWGLVYADCGDQVYQGITCPECKWTSLLDFPKDNPLVDLRDFIIIPHPDSIWNTAEQVHEEILRIRQRDSENDTLRFKFIPAWDSERVGLEDMANSFADMSRLEFSGNPDTFELDDPKQFSEFENYYGEFSRSYQTQEMIYRTSHEDGPSQITRGDPDKPSEAA